MFSEIPKIRQISIGNYRNREKPQLIWLRTMSTNSIQKVTSNWYHSNLITMKFGKIIRLFVGKRLVNHVLVSNNQYPTKFKQSEIEVFVFVQRLIKRFIYASLWRLTFTLNCYRHKHNHFQIGQKVLATVSNKTFAEMQRWWWQIVYDNDMSAQ